jgi:Asp-tRNA(Asn)/Glu-tRNA(Gln) amidotransferase A subunit family amidase
VLSNLHLRISTTGPITRTAADAAIMSDTIAGFDPQDQTSVYEPPPNVLRQLDRGINGVRIGIDRNYPFTGMDAGQKAALEKIPAEPTCGCPIQALLGWACHLVILPRRVRIHVFA